MAHTLSPTGSTPVLYGGVAQSEEAQVSKTWKSEFKSQHRYHHKKRRRDHGGITPNTSTGSACAPPKNHTPAPGTLAAADHGRRKAANLNA